MSLAYIRKHYQVPAYRGAWIVFQEYAYVIRSARGAYLRVSPFAGSKVRLTIHPTWEVDYIEVVKKRRTKR